MRKTKTKEEHRSYPRVKTDLEASASGNPVQCADLSEGGMRMEAAEMIASPSVTVQVCFAGLKFELKTDARLVWKRELEDGNSSYGVEFTGLSQDDQSALRKELIKAQIEDLLNDVEDPGIRDDIAHFFLESLTEYIRRVIGLNARLAARERRSLAEGGLAEENGHSPALQKELEGLNTEVLLKGYSLSLLLSDTAVMRRVKENFRSLVGTWIYKGGVLKRALDKPGGHPGDYRVLEAIYNKSPLSQGLGEYYDRDFLNSPYAVALRSRKDKIRDMLKSFITRRAQKSALKILSLGCGSCREIVELAGGMECRHALIFTCVDKDQEALDYAGELLNDAPGHVRVDLTRDDVVGMTRAPENLNFLYQQDLVYSLGWADYLPDDVLKTWLQYFARVLRPGGQFVITLKNREKSFAPLPPDWFCDWAFVPRSKEEMAALVRGALSGFSMDITQDDFGYIYYFTLTKP